MPVNNNAHATRLIESLRHAKGIEAADLIASAHPLSRSADIHTKYRWACDICIALEQHFGADAPAIRRNCRCGDGNTMAKEIAKCINTAGSLADGCAAFTAKNKYAFLEYISENEVIFGYHACVCSCIKRADGFVPRLWCECSVGYAFAMFQQVFGSSVQVSLLKSVGSGSERCELCIRW